MEKMLSWKTFKLYRLTYIVSLPVLVAISALLNSDIISALSIFLMRVIRNCCVSVILTRPSLELGNSADRIPKHKILITGNNARI